MTDTLYDQDFVVWTEHQASALRDAARDGSNLPLDWANLAEEIEDLGKEQRNAVRSLTFQILVHILKLGCSAAPGPKIGWAGELDGFRRQLHRRLEDSQKLRSEMEDTARRELPAAIKDVRRSFERYGEPEGLGKLAAWEVRRISPAEVLDEDLFPDPDTPGFLPRETSPGPSGG